MKTITYIYGILILALFSSQAMADIELTTTAQVEVTETNAQGEKIVKREPAARVVPGKEVIYTIRATNTGDQPAGSIVVTNPIPEHTEYVEGSAFGSGTDITFSVDGGNSYGKPDQLSVKTADGKSRPATAKDYTHVRWIFQFELQPGKQAPVWYRVQVK